LPLVGLSIFALVGLFIGVKWYNKSDSSVSLPEKQVLVEVKETPPPLPEKEMISENSLIEPPQDIIPVSETERPAEEAVTEPQLSSSTVTLKVTEDAWIQVIDNEGNVIVSRIFKPQERYEFKQSENLILKTGNARGTQLISGEKKLSFPKNIDPVQTNIPLDPAKWVDHSSNTL
jgi:hypothetical protein